MPTKDELIKAIEAVGGDYSTGDTKEDLLASLARHLGVSQPAATPMGAVTVTRGVPNLEVRVIGDNCITITEDNAVAGTKPGFYKQGHDDRLVLEGPTAQQFQAQGMVEIVGAVPEG